MNSTNSAQQLYDIYPLWHIPFWQTTWFYAFLISIACILLALIFFLAWKKFRKKKVVIELPWQWALRELRALEQKSVTTKEDGKQYYFTLTDIIKRYLHARFGLLVISMTDDELVQYLRASEQLPEYRDAIADIAQGCVYIKFANEQAMQEQIKKHSALAITLVTQTTPIERKK